MEILPVQLFCGPKPEQSRFEPVTGGIRGGEVGMKPRGGLWTSTWETAFEEGWPSWCLGEQFQVDSLVQGWLLTPAPCRVLTIDGIDTALPFMREYGEEKIPDNPGLSFYPNWRRVAQDYDAVRLTAPYDPALRWGSEEIGITFYGWDCESTVWLSWKFDGEAEAVDLHEQIAAVPQSEWS